MNRPTCDQMADRVAMDVPERNPLNPPRWHLRVPRHSERAATRLTHGWVLRRRHLSTLVKHALAGQIAAHLAPAKKRGSRSRPVKTTAQTRSDGDKLREGQDSHRVDHGSWPTPAA